MHLWRCRFNDFKCFVFARTKGMAHLKAEEHLRETRKIMDTFIEISKWEIIDLGDSTEGERVIVEF